jgi:UDP-N-acetylmuramate--alanine ligase
MKGALESRRIFFAGIGGAGLSGYAVLAAAWGGEVSGWDRAETPYLAYVRAAGIPVTISPEPPGPPDGAEVVVSSAFPEIAGRSRAEFLAELVSLRRSIVVAGTHGKTTTAAMIAFCLDRLGHDPAFLIGGEVPQLGGNARAGDGWLVVEGDESDRTVEALRPEIAVLTNVELDHHATFASPVELEELFERWLEDVRLVIRGPSLETADISLSLPGEHNRRNAACALAALEAAGVPRPDAAAVLAEFRGVRRRLEFRGELDGVRVVDDYGHHPSEVAAALATLRENAPGRLLVLFQPHLYSRTRHLAREFAGALAAADAVGVTEIYAAREQPVEGVSGKLVVDALSELRPGMPIGWSPTVTEGVDFVRQRARPGDTVLTIGAGDIDAAAALFLGEHR